MPAPSSYLEMLAQLPSRDITFDFGGVHLAAPDELQNAQIGYAISAGGESFCGDKDGDWRQSWFVIGNETTCGDPLFIDTAKPGLPVFTAEHGQGTWSPNLIAISASAFAKSLSAFAEVAAQTIRPISDAERATFLKQIVLANDSNADVLTFWDMLLEDDSIFMGEPEDAAQWMAINPQS